jgi:hypothetical protein
MGRYTLIVLLTAGCSSLPPGLPLTDFQESLEPKIQYFGVGGYLVHWRDEGLLIAPLFSWTSLLFPPLMVTPNKDEIDLRMPRADDVTMLLVGHGHYDHLLDVPWILKEHTPEAHAYGSKTVGIILRAEIEPCRVIDAEEKMATVSTNRTVRGSWFYSKHKRFRAMAIQSVHAPHLGEITLAHGIHDSKFETLPSAVWRWKDGQVLTWIIDLLDEQLRTVYRVHYQDSASTPPYGLPPYLNDGKDIDIDILAASSWSNVDNYPGTLLKTANPDLVVLGHWENFIGGDIENPTPMPGQNIDGLYAKVLESIPDKRKIMMPMPLSYIPVPDGDEPIQEHQSSSDDIEFKPCAVDSAF